MRQFETQRLNPNWPRSSVFCRPPQAPGGHRSSAHANQGPSFGRGGPSTEDGNSMGISPLIGDLTMKHWDLLGYSQGYHGKKQDFPMSSFPILLVSIIFRIRFSHLLHCNQLASGSLVKGLRRLGRCPRIVILTWINYPLVNIQKAIENGHLE